jgi:hypothetical protein
MHELSPGILARTGPGSGKGNHLTMSTIRHESDLALESCLPRGMDEELAGNSVVETTTMSQNLFYSDFTYLISDMFVPYLTVLIPAAVQSHEKERPLSPCILFGRKSINTSDNIAHP